MCRFHALGEEAQWINARLRHRAGISARRSGSPDHSHPGICSLGRNTGVVGMLVGTLYVHFLAEKPGWRLLGILFSGLALCLLRQRSFSPRRTLPVPGTPVLGSRKYQLTCRSTNFPVHKVKPGTVPNTPVAPRTSLLVSALHPLSRLNTVLIPNCTGSFVVFLECVRADQCVWEGGSGVISQVVCGGSFVSAAGSVPGYDWAVISAPRQPWAGCRLLLLRTVRLWTVPWGLHAPRLGRVPWSGLAGVHERRDPYHLPRGRVALRSVQSPRAVHIGML